MKSIHHFLSSYPALPYTVIALLFLFLIIPVSLELITDMSAGMRDLLRSMEIALQETGF